jgi:putative flippase GtrA
MTFIKSLSNIILIRYVLVSALIYVTDFSTFYILNINLNFSEIANNFISKFLAFFVAFFGHRYFTFSIKNDGQFRDQLLKSILACGINALVSNFFLKITLYYVDNVYYAKLISDIISFFISFLISKYYVFRRKVKS